MWAYIYINIRGKQSRWLTEKTHTNIMSGSISEAPTKRPVDKSSEGHRVWRSRPPWQATTPPIRPPALRYGSCSRHHRSGRPVCYRGSSSGLRAVRIHLSKLYIYQQLSVTNLPDVLFRLEASPDRSNDLCLPSPAAELSGSHASYPRHTAVAEQAPVSMAVQSVIHQV